MYELIYFPFGYWGILGAPFAHQTPLLKQAGNISNYALGLPLPTSWIDFFSIWICLKCSWFISFLFGFVFQYSESTSFLCGFLEVFLFEVFSIWTFWNILNCFPFYLDSWYILNWFLFYLGFFNWLNWFLFYLAIGDISGMHLRTRPLFENKRATYLIIP